ncbi:MAG: formate/nitrite transporter family protein [Paludibacteraceae bacterium]|nr:formate/nitrite transporter family protein [Paludibacteraceae bacterium]
MGLLKTLLSSVVAGICIAIGGVAYLKVGGLEGAVLFSFGLLSVTHYALWLYTGTAGFFDIKCFRQWVETFIVLLGNVMGCWIVALSVRTALPSLLEVAANIANTRLSSGFLNDFILGCGCGFIMTTSVQFARLGRYLPLLFGVPLFIMCGFAHSIADAFYLLLNYTETFSNHDLICAWLSVVGGNFVGCNIYRLTLWKF